MSLSKLHSAELLEVLKFMNFDDLIKLCTTGNRLKILIEHNWRKHLTLNYIHSIRVHMYENDIGSFNDKDAYKKGFIRAELLKITDGTNQFLVNYNGPSVRAI